MHLFNRSKTKAYTFLLPMLYGHEDAHKSTNAFKNIHNVYISKDGDSIECVNMANKAIYSLKIEPKFKSDINLFKEGNYSKLSPLLKNKILKFWLCDDLIKSILFKGNTSKKYWDNLGYNTKLWSEDIEHWPQPDINKEQLI